MHPSSTVSYDLAQARIADLRHQARRDGLARAAARTTGRTGREFRAASTGPSMRHRAPRRWLTQLSPLGHRGVTMSSVPCDLSVSTLSTGAARADALFASALQRSDEPSPGQVRRAIAVAVAAYGGSECAARVAQAFGEAPRDRRHPDALGAHDGRPRRPRHLPRRLSRRAHHREPITWGLAPPWSRRRRKWREHRDRVLLDRDPRAGRGEHAGAALPERQPDAPSAEVRRDPQPSPRRTSSQRASSSKSACTRSSRGSVSSGRLRRSAISSRYQASSPRCGCAGPAATSRAWSGGRSPRPAGPGIVGGGPADARRTRSGGPRRRPGPARDRCGR